MALPLRSYLGGVELVWRLHEGTGHGCRVLGRTHGHGVWYYFPLAILTKTPGAFLALLALSLALAIRRGHGPRLAEAIAFIPPGVFLLLVLRSQVTIGVRHLLPLCPFAFVWASRVVRRGQSSRALTALIVILAVWQAASVLHAGPHYLAYFNWLAGGPARGAEIFRDSNVDWGQDLRLLARYQARHPETEPLGLAYFGTASPRAYGVRAQGVRLERPWPGCLAVSVTLLNEEAPEQAWIRARPIAARIGGSIRVYGPSDPSDPPDPPLPLDPP